MSILIPYNISFYCWNLNSPYEKLYTIGFNEDMKSQASLKYNGAVNVNHNLKGISHGNVLH